MIWVCSKCGTIIDYELSYMFDDLDILAWCCKCEEMVVIKIKDTH